MVNLTNEKVVKTIFRPQRREDAKKIKHKDEKNVAGKIFQYK